MSTLLFLVTEDWYFCSHRLPIARAAQAAGLDVVVVTRVRKHGEQIRQEGFRLIALEQRRGALSPIADLGVLWKLIRIYRNERPDLVHHVALKPVLYGTLAARATHIPRVVNALGGLGYVFASGRVAARILRAVLAPVLRVVLSASTARIRVIVQNPEDRQLLLQRVRLQQDSVKLIRGSGVDVARFMPVPEPAGVPIVALVSRMLWDKGIAETVEAARILEADGIPVRVVLVGAPDPENPRSVPESMLREWHESRVIEWWGRREDIPAVWARAHICVLPTYYGEGVPKTLLEAAACGRPIIATDAPGCREIVHGGENGILVPPKDPAALAEAMKRLIKDPQLRMRFGQFGRRLVEKDFSEEVVVAQTVQIYQSLFGDCWPSGPPQDLKRRRFRASSIK